MPLSPEEQAELASLQQKFESKPKSGIGPNPPPGWETLLSPEAKARISQSSKDALEAVSANFMPAGTANPLSWLSQKTGLSKIPAKLMSSAVGIKKYIPGVGENLLSEGIGGTKSMMEGQVEKGLAARDAEKNAILSKLPGTVNSSDVAVGVSGLTDRFSTPGGIVPKTVAPEFNKVMSSAQDIANRGPVSAPEAGKLASIAGSLGYRGNEPVQRLEGLIGRKEHAGYRQGLEDLFAKANPEQPNALADVYSKESALVKAQKGLRTPETNTVGSTIKSFLPSSLIQSVAAQSMSKAGDAANAITPRIAGRAAAAQINALSPDEQAEFEQLRKQFEGQ